MKDNPGNVSAVLPIGAGQHSAVWNGKDFHGTKVASGVYLYQLKATGFVAAKKLMLTK